MPSGMKVDMSSPAECARRYRESLEPYIKPREQVLFIRRILAASLESSSPDGLIRRPLSLAQGEASDETPTSLEGVHKEYLEALRANAVARQRFESVARARVHGSPSEELPATPTNKSDFANDQVALLQLRRKRERLLVIKDYLDNLAGAPEASDSFFEPSRMFQNATPLPQIPPEIVSNMVAAQTSEPQDLKSQAARLEKVALRARLLYKQEEQLLAQARKNAESLPEIVSNGARLEALSATRNELINWIESELSHAATGDQDDGTVSDKQVDQASIDAQIEQVKAKYEKYVSSRKALLEMVEQEPRVSFAPSPKPREVEETAEGGSQPTEYFLTPYIERLLQLSRTQKAMIAQKSHIGNALSKQAKDTCQSLGHLAEESQLLPAYPMKDSLRRRSGLQDELTGKGSGRPDVATRIKPWVFAADSAKIASLEAVTEDIEKGQISLEATMESLGEIRQLLGQPGRQKQDIEGSAEADETDDVWLTGESPSKNKGARKHTVKAKTTVAGDPWSELHGSLGLIGSDDVG